MIFWFCWIPGFINDMARFHRVSGNQRETQIQRDIICFRNKLFYVKGKGGNGTTFLVTSITHYFNHLFVEYWCPKFFDIVENLCIFNLYFILNC